MSALDRITVKYVQREDRIRLAGETSHGQIVVVWITRRLLDRLLSRLASLLESMLGEQDSDPLRVQALQSFAQHVAQATSTAEPPVRPGEDDMQWLAQSVDVTVTRKDVRLAFSGEDTQRVEMTLVERKLRQLLNIFLEVYRQAGWPLNAWPQWACSASASSKRAPAQVH